VYDSLNNAILLPTKEYAPGKVALIKMYNNLIKILPPHLSPFVNDEEEGYVPERKKEINKIKGESIQEEIEENKEKEAGVNEYEEYDFEEELRKQEISEK